MKSGPRVLDLALLIPALFVGYGLISWSASAYRVVKARTTSRAEVIKAIYDHYGTSERWILKAMAGNPACPSELLTELAGLENLDDAWRANIRDLISGSRRSVLRLVSLNPSTPPEVLRELADAGQWPEILSNPSTPVDVLEEAVSKGRAEDRRRIAVAATAVEILESLSTDPEQVVRRLVAKNPGAPASVLARLAGDSVGSIRSAVAANPNTSKETLETLSSDASPSVRNQALSRLGRAAGGKDSQQQSESDGG